MLPSKAPTHSHKKTHHCNTPLDNILIMKNGVFVPPKSSRQREKAHARSPLKEIIVISLDEDEQPGHDNSRKISELEHTVQNLMKETQIAKDAQELVEKVLACVDEELDDVCEEALQETSNAIQAQEEAEKKLADCKGELEEIHDELGEPKIETSQLEPDATCEISFLSVATYLAQSASSHGSPPSGMITGETNMGSNWDASPSAVQRVDTM
ncbi:hypothetical protein ARMGADRAFT_1070388 [Armillaria gallica]|uniref:Uncharacterized protein n=1 Tax=Armillaria gallica TaxID=47427 RepID=A0A2H3E8Z5_ARMGA|nr:hypothetical protein ARMGADRAFT_1070388 [Armillaria gallica]